MAGRRIGAQIDFGLVDYWISSCNAHGSGCSKPTLPGPVESNIRLIDIKARRLVWARTSYTYAALSYMWGPPSLQQARLTRSSEAELFSEGSLGDNNTVPRTIRDAMIVCERLRIPYLWVDALCIEQDSPDFNVHLQKMNDIYAAAYLTIVAASGTDSWAGLPGVMPNSRHVYQPSILIKNIDIGLAVPEFWSSVVNSPWANRGWTFQERLFSNRMLIFAQSQCFFYCDKISRFESTITEIGDGAEQIPYSLFSTLEWAEMRTKFKAEVFSTSTKETLGAYFALFRNYRRLALTYQTDVLRAFSGVMATFGRQMSTSFHFGLPLSTFTWALLMDYTHCVRRPEFPSWTWVGWSEDRLDFNDLASTYVGTILGEFRTTTTFYRLHPTSNDINVQDSWTLEAIHDSQTPGARDARLDEQSVYRSQQVPADLDRTFLEKLLVFDAPASNIEIQETVRDAGREFDIEYKMSFGTISWGDVRQDIIDFSYHPYVPSIYFDEDMANTSVSKTMELIQIGKYYDENYQEVCLMLVDTDKRGISTRVSLCTMKESLWLSNDLERKRFYLM